MEVDELSHNVFYLLLRNEYKRKYDFALKKCWTICVPCTDSLREISITNEFIDDHVLKPDSESNTQFRSTDEGETHLYKIDNCVIKLINDDESNHDYKVNILSFEKGYNKEYQAYNMIIVDKPVHRKYRIIITQISQSDKLELNRNILSHKEAVNFLNELQNKKLLNISDLVFKVKSIDINQNNSMDDLKQILQKLICNYWAIIMRKQKLDIQRDARFQKLLSISLEIFVMHQIHDTLYFILGNLFNQQDLGIRTKIDHIIDASVSLDHLRVKESFPISMPNSMTELATLDSHKGPHEKLTCMKRTLDIIIAEFKGAIADMKSRNDFFNDSNDGSNTNLLNSDDLIPLLLYIIIKCRSQKLHTNLYYIENFIWSITPHDDLSYTLVIYRAALKLLEQIVHK
ncbi:PREDICTED: putative uncharacterized protein DDB_G0284213 [Ceratosolen solmsi marchali]|uniref:VPS9 domain-containing protein n=1 Tax=Ceratosolen solmsi marchali TaxID=326594 RepID=A0AAJ6YL12_9HYME|nr:PREDICTED: putative uncharacterized protein DDB_G0284213 [Ceratosolen solmsi marchali]